MKRTQIEFWKSHYGLTTLHYNNKTVDLNGNYTDLLLKVSKGFELRIADGDTIYFLTEKQLTKLESILKTI